MNSANSVELDPGLPRRLLLFFNREFGFVKYRIVAGSVAAGLSRGALLATFNAAAAEGARHVLDWGLIGTFLACLLVYLTASYDAACRSEIVMRQMMQRLRMRLCDRLLSAPLTLVEAQGPGKIVTQIGADVEHLAGCAWLFLSNLQSAVVLLFALVYLSWLSLPGLAAVLLTFTVSVAAYYRQDKKAALSMQEARAIESSFFERLNDLLHGFKELKLTAARRMHFAEDMRENSEQYRVLMTRAANMYQASSVTSQAFTFSLIALLVFFLPAVFPSSSVSVFQFLATILFVIGPAEQLVSFIPWFTRGKIALASIERLERNLAIEPGALLDAGAAAPFSFRTIAFRQVHFRFQGASEKESFDLGPIDLELHHGEALFICGGNGAGKTTLLKLLTGLYHPASGTIAIDGREIAPEDFQNYREMFAAVFSDFYLFRKLYGIPDPDPAYIDKLLTTLQLRHKTRHEDGAFVTLDLSTGQRKRLAFAVSRLNDRQIYVFDEFAADQDPAFRNYFYTALLPELKRQGKTLVVVTHDDRWFEAGDRLVKLDYGKIVSDGASLKTLPQANVHG